MSWLMHSGRRLVCSTPSLSWLLAKKMCDRCLFRAAMRARCGVDASSVHPPSSFVPRRLETKQSSLHEPRRIDGTSIFLSTNKHGEPIELITPSVEGVTRSDDPFLALDLKTPATGPCSRSLAERHSTQRSLKATRGRDFCVKVMRGMCFTSHDSSQVLKSSNPSSQLSISQANCWPSKIKIQET